MLDVLRALARSGAVRPAVPRPSLLRTLLLAPLRTPTLGTAVEVQAGLTPHGPALVDDAGTLSWRELDERVNRLANLLLASADPGDRVAWLLRNGREAVECYAACGRAGMVAVPANTWWSPRDVAAMTEAQQPRVVLADADLAPPIAGALADGVRVILVAGEGPGLHYEDMLALAPAGAPVTRGLGKVVVHTSGTTGRAKGAERSLSAAAADHLVAFLDKVPLRRDDRLLVAPPLFHTFAQGMLGIALVLGSTAVLQRRFDAEVTRRFLTDQRVTAAAVVPAMLRRLVDAGGPTPDALRLVVSSGSALPQALRQDAETALGAGVYDLYGSTEAGWATIATPEDARIRPGTAGRPGPRMRVVVADDEGRPLPAGRVGRVLVQTGWAFAGYTGERADARAHATASETIDMGDLGHLDDDGYLFVVGRADDMVISGGENIYPSEVEDALHAHPGVAEAAVAGVDDPDLGQALHAWVVLRDGAGTRTKDLQAFLRRRVARYKVPRTVHIVDELPRNATGKVVKRALITRPNPPAGPPG